jgi:dipeptidase
MSQKTETIEEFLARGGKITVIPQSSTKVSAIVPVKAQNTGIVSLMSLEEAELMYGETKSKVKNKNQKNSNIDVSALPTELVQKLLNKINSADEKS